VIRSRSSQHQTSRAALISIVAALVGLLGLPGAALGHATTASKTVHYHGSQVTVPASWPVFHLDAASRTCVRFNRHAVYVGRPGGDQSCPVSAIGRTEAILISPASYRGDLLTPVSQPRAETASGSMLRLRDRKQHVVITATWNHDPAVIRRALGLRSLREAARATNSRRPSAPAIPARDPRGVPRVTSPATPALPGQVYTGLGFDVCSAPSAGDMAVWGESSPYAAIGIYIGGANAACLGGNLNAAWVSGESAAGWHMIPTYVGLQSPQVSGKPSSSCGACAAMSATAATAATQGTAAAQDAVAQAQALGIGTGNPIYYDMENYTRSTTATAAVLAFLQAWTVQLHTMGYQSGVYSSGSSGITDLVHSAYTSYIEPDEVWTASWYSSAPATPPTSTANSWVPSTDWIGTHQLLQYYSDPSGKAENYGGVTIGIDRDYVNAPTAAYGSGTLVSQVAAAPSLVVKPQPNGWVSLAPSWTGEPGVTSYVLLGGRSPTALTAIETVSATTKFPVKLQGVYAYFEVQALNSLGQVIGTSVPVQTPPSVAIFGNSAYVGAKGPVGVPVACLNSAPCQLEASIFDGKKRIAHSEISSVSRHGGQLLVPLSTQTHKLVASAINSRLPATVTVTSSSGARATRPLNLVPYTISGKAPTRRAWSSTALQILAETSFVSNAWTGGILAVCKSSTPCLATTRVTLGGVALAQPKTQTLGAGEIGYLTYQLNAKAHALLREKVGNQLGARVTVTTAAPTSTGGAAATAGTKNATALISLESFR
jgi:hypothetical protein